MGVYIKDMEIPKTCGECEFFARKRGVGQYCVINDKITFHATLNDFDVDYKRNGICPLVPIPPHGRLIDADALKETMKIITRTEVQEIVEFDRNVYKVDDAPTIIPAEKE